MCDDSRHVQRKITDGVVAPFQNQPLRGGIAGMHLAPVQYLVTFGDHRQVFVGVLQWTAHKGICIIPRSTVPAHMAENLQAFDIALNATEVAMLSSRPQGWCSVDAAWYECAK